MNYEVVDVKEKIVAGLAIRTSNNDSNMAESIGYLWQKFFNDGVYQSISMKQNDNSIGLYTNYESDANGAYDMMVCCEIITPESLSMGVNTMSISAGKYAKFIVRGDVQKAVAEFWTKLWAMDLDRKYSCDFEEYQSGCEMSNAEIHIYISLN
ncbi:MAG: putative AraC family transcriptional regulator [Firmicutes bacterium]|nr:putative AraC family transcriptional regulator [Bacillota bacterium]